MQRKTAWWGLDGATDSDNQGGSVYQDEDGQDGVDAYPLLIDTAFNAARYKALEAQREESANIADTDRAEVGALRHLAYLADAAIGGTVQRLRVEEHSADAAAANRPVSSDIVMDSSEDDEEGDVADSSTAVQQGLLRQMAELRQQQEQERQRQQEQQAPKRMRLWDPAKLQRQKELQEQQQRLREQEEEEEQERQQMLQQSYVPSKRRRICGHQSSDESLGSTDHHLKTGRSIWRQF